ncbi:leukocyte elastase inhibitor, putative [Entamoeba invadens IP1]|uniref:Leukocyte elastase inhibitor, putative n=2 Tax=Entamoeba invadens TaxID=33085 RepID=L7FJ61_ENTIV|nr:leukocyte elastase inhibitor, putative [Entamoeba invadens IP1]ELP83871.1 leukocyte elastase inhibitor, putative [Entamoeba invadens IP1]BAN40565.1 leukocyte elastase inhibitor, putative [Entamoeba invadens]BAN41718.1 leukocyte elastase inhibitor, putative [Entamoeba invadens]|eukprot:XP_004183217.1 leukocyte elastase inhibitor, putative [Entamoeba invadens IP1]
MSLDWQVITPLQKILYKLCAEWYTTSAQKEDVVYSTHSMFICFAMLYLGSDANTKKQLESVFGYSSIPEEKFLNTMGQIVHKEPNQQTCVEIVNAIWAGMDLKFKDQFLAAVAKMECQMKNGDFKKNCEAVRQEINTFVQTATKDVIKDFIQPGVISPDTVSVIINAIYFKGEWDKPFHILPNKMEFEGAGEVTAMKVNVDSSASFEDDYTTVSVCYKGFEHKLVFVMPTNMKEFEAKKGLEQLKDIVVDTIQSFPEKRNVTIPKFSVESSFEMNDQLMKLGLTDPFGCAADFSKMSDTKTYVSAAIHKAVVKVDEVGTVAAAATGIAMNRCCMRPMAPPRDVIINKPYYFAIVEGNNLPLFFGKVSHPKF